MANNVNTASGVKLVIVMSAMADSQKRLQHFLNFMKQTCAMTDKIETPISRYTYDINYDAIERLRDEYNEVLKEKEILDSLWNSITNLIEHEIPDTIKLASQKLNNLNLAFGLQGELKKHLMQNPHLLCSDEFVKEVLEQPYRKISKE